MWTRLCALVLTLGLLVGLGFPVDALEAVLPDVSTGEAAADGVTAEGEEAAESTEGEQPEVEAVEPDVTPEAQDEAQSDAEQGEAPQAPDDATDGQDALPPENREPTESEAPEPAEEAWEQPEVVTQEGGAQATAQAEEEAQASPAYETGELVVLFKADVTEARALELVAALGGVVPGAPASVGGQVLVLVALPGGMGVEEGVTLFAQQPEVAATQPNYREERPEPEAGAQANPPQAEGQAEFTLANDARVAEQWYLEQINLEPAWRQVDDVQGEKVRVAVIDSGVDWTHPDMMNNLNRELSADFSTGEKAALQWAGAHGTHIAGLIAAQSNNGQYYAGIATGPRNTAVEVVSLDVFRDSRLAFTYDIILALNYAVDVGAQVVNMSLGAQGEKAPVFEAAVDAAAEQGVVIVASAGNEGNGKASWPSDFRNVISVTALDSRGARADYSNYGAAKWIAAPGGTIGGDGDTLYDSQLWNLAPVGNDDGTQGMFGTSQAAAVVSGVVSLMRYVNPDIGPQQVKDILAATARDVGEAGWDIYTGWGCVDAGAAVAQAALERPKATEISLNMQAKTLQKKGKEVQLKATTLPMGLDAGVEWSSSKESVATVDASGRVVARAKKGTATITARTANGLVAKCKITVGKTPVSKVRLNLKKKTLEWGEKLKLEATVSPAAAANKKVSWTTSDPLVVSVSSKGTVTALMPGKATVTVRSQDGGKKASCKVTVKGQVTGVKLNKSRASMRMGETVLLKATVFPKDAEDRSVGWKTSDAAVAVVSSKGRVRGVGKGSATITVTTFDGKKRARCKVTVK